MSHIKDHGQGGLVVRMWIVCSFPSLIFGEFSKAKAMFSIELFLFQVSSLLHKIGFQFLVIHLCFFMSEGHSGLQVVDFILVFFSFLFHS